MSVGDEDKESAARLARVVEAVTKIIASAWNLQGRMGDGLGEHVHDAVLALVTERSPRAQFQMIADWPESLSHEAERLLDRCADFLRSQPDADPSYIRLFETHLNNIKLVRADRVDINRVPVSPLPAAERDRILADARAPQTASELDDLARTLRDRGQIEEARHTFGEAIRKARAEGDAAVEGSAEIGLFTLIERTARPTPDSRARKLEHARRAAEAYARAGDRLGERQAVVAMITVLTDTADRPNLDRALDRLARLDEDHARWWRAYSTAMTDADLDERKAGLRWCVESAGLLGEHADFYRKMCAAKLAFFEGRAVPLDDEDSAVFQTGVTVLDVMSNGPSEAAAEQLAKIVRAVEEKRRYARSQALQRELSDAYEAAYWAAMLCAEKLRAPEDAVDYNELNSSRALLAQTGMHQIWRQWHPQTLEDARSEALQRLFGRFAVSPTTHNRRLLTLAFERQREVQQRKEQELLSSTPGLTTAPPAMSVRSFRTVLAEDHRVVVYGATGSIFLVTRDECRVIGRFPLAEVGAIVERALTHLTDPADSSPAALDAIAWLAEHVVQPVADQVPEGGRLFLVPHGPLWQVPLGALAPANLAETRDVSYVPSLTLLARLLTTPRLERDVERFVGFGDPDGSLPHARAEIGHAASTFVDSFTVLGKRLHYHMAMANLADADVAHLACHGTFFPDHPDFSALHIAGLADRPEVLWHGDLARYQLNARLVVLAACHGGTGRALFGSEYVGLPGAFLAAGARGVLAPLWAVPDGSTATLMRHFYDALKRMVSPAAALRQAQHAIAAAPATAHPYYWAGFQLFGAAPGHQPFGDAE